MVAAMSSKKPAVKGLDALAALAVLVVTEHSDVTDEGREGMGAPFWRFDGCSDPAPIDARRFRLLGGKGEVGGEGEREGEGEGGGDGDGDWPDSWLVVDMVVRSCLIW